MTLDEASFGVRTSVPFYCGLNRRRWFAPTFWRLAARPGSDRAQAVLAELLAQALAADMPFVEAVDAVAEALAGSRLRRMLVNVGHIIRNGETIEDSFRWAGIPLHDSVQVALQLGQERRTLEAELASVARNLDVHVASRAARAVGRRPSACRFALVLARLLSQQSLTAALVHDAARLAGGSDRRFSKVVRNLAADVEGGESLADALMRYPDLFDPLFGRCIEHAASRAVMRHVLVRLAGKTDNVGP